MRCDASKNRGLSGAGYTEGRKLARKRAKGTVGMAVCKINRSRCVAEGRQQTAINHFSGNCFT